MALLKRSKQTTKRGATGAVTTAVGGEDESGTSVMEAAASDDVGAVMTGGETKEDKKGKKKSDDNGGEKKRGLFGRRSSKESKGRKDSVGYTSPTSRDPQKEPEVSRLRLGVLLKIMVDCLPVRYSTAETMY